MANLPIYKNTVNSVYHHPEQRLSPEIGLRIQDNLFVVALEFLSARPNAASCFFFLPKLAANVRFPHSGHHTTLNGFVVVWPAPRSVMNAWAQCPPAKAADL